jgi:hypothetical protein
MCSFIFSNTWVQDAEVSSPRMRLRGVSQASGSSGSGVRLTEEQLKELEALQVGGWVKQKG